MKKEYRFAIIEFQEHDACVVCPKCKRHLADREYIVKMPSDGNLLWICAPCAANQSLLDGMERFELQPTHFVAFGERTIAAFEAESVDTAKGLIAR